MKLENFWLYEILGEVSEDFTNGVHNDEFIVVKSVEPNKVVLTFDSNCLLHYAEEYKNAAREWFEDLAVTLSDKKFVISETDSLDNDSLSMEITDES